jgi:hypothetical protein
LYSSVLLLIEICCPNKNLLFEAEIYVPGYAQNAGFCTIYPRASGGLERPLTLWHKDHLRRVLYL